MTSIAHTGLSQPRGPVIMRTSVTVAGLALLGLLAQAAHAQKPMPQARDDLDVTMQIIVDPDAKLPDEVVRRIPLPARKPAEPPPDRGRTPAKSDAAVPEQERSREGREQGREVSEAAQERSREAAEQREAARRSAAEERRRERGPPDDRGRPQTPPRR